MRSLRDGGVAMMASCDQFDCYLTDLRRHGKDRADRRRRHIDIRRDFRRRQIQLAAVGCWLILLFVISSVFLLGALALLVFSTATDECRRMRACGRYWQCKRSIEVIGT